MVGNFANKYSVDLKLKANFLKLCLVSYLVFHTVKISICHRPRPLEYSAHHLKEAYIQNFPHGTIQSCSNTTSSCMTACCGDGSSVFQYSIISHCWLECNGIDSIIHHISLATIIVSAYHSRGIW